MARPLGDPVQRCSGCGAGLSLDDLRGSSCPYCQLVLPHRAQAQQGAALVGEMLADRDGDGVPDAFAPLVRSATAPHSGPVPAGASRSDHGATVRAVGTAVTWVVAVSLAAVGAVAVLAVALAVVLVR